MSFKAEELDQRVQFRREVKTADNMGGAVTSWQTIATVWAKVRPMRGGERERADRLNVEANYLIVIRPNSDIDETCIAVWNGHQFNLRFIKSHPRGNFVEIEAEKGVAL